MRRLSVLTAIFLGLLVAFALAGNSGFQTAVPAEATQTTVTWMYPASGGLTIPANGPTTTTDVAPAPCTNCYITSIVPDLVYMGDPDHTNGTQANYNNNGLDNIWLHHMVIVDGCNLTRIFASGNERTTFSIPAGYGYYLGAGCQWLVNYHLHNSSNNTRNVALKLVVTYRTAETLVPITPVQWDVSSSSGDAEYTIPEGYSDTQTGSGAPGIAADWTSNIQGLILGIGGHVHDYGISVSAYNNRLGDYICTSVAGYGTGSRYWPTGGPGTAGHPSQGNQVTMLQAYHEAGGVPDNRYHIQQMTTCAPTPRQSILCIGDVVRLHTQYNNTSGFPVFDAMGIMSAAVATNLPDSDTDGTIDACEDNDTDGLVNSADNCPDWSNPAQNMPTWTVPAGDTDCDGYPSTVAASGKAPETFISTNPSKKCASTPAMNDEAGADAWPMDFDDNQKSLITDVTRFGPVFNVIGPGAPYAVRFDLNGDGKITITDVTQIGPFFNKSCSP